MKETLPKKREALAALRRAYALDARGREEEAIPPNRKALRLGVPGGEQKHALIGLASSLRNVGRAAEARRVIERARRTYKGDPAVEAFYALVLHDLGEGDKAHKVLGKAFLTHVHDARLKDYRQALARKFNALTRKTRPKP